MRHVTAGCGFLLALYLPFWWSMPQAQPSEGGLGAVFALVGLSIYGVLAILALIMYYALFHASLQSIVLAATAVAAIVSCWKFHWIAGTEALESGALAGAILAHHCILRAMSPARTST
jgi:hypothetical protein